MDEQPRTVSFPTPSEEQLYQPLAGSHISIIRGEGGWLARASNHDAFGQGSTPANALHMLGLKAYAEQLHPEHRM